MADEQPDRVSVPTLVMTGGPLDGTAYPLQFTGREIIVGSSLDADVQILLGNVESFHSRISFESGALLLSDAGSATGTFVNGEKIENAHPLQEGDRICLGPPGAKGSAKLIVRMPGSTHSPLLFGSDGEPPDLGEAGTARGSEEPSLFLGSAGDSGSCRPPSTCRTRTPSRPLRRIVEDDGSEGERRRGAHAGRARTTTAGSSSRRCRLHSRSLRRTTAPADAPAFASLDDEIPVPAFAPEQEPGLPASRPLEPPQAAPPPPLARPRPPEPPAPPPPPKPPPSG